jgi:hypothetical protein
VTSVHAPVQHEIVFWGSTHECLWAGIQPLAWRNWTAPAAILVGADAARSGLIPATGGPDLGSVDRGVGRAADPYLCLVSKIAGRTAVEERKS